MQTQQTQFITLGEFASGAFLQGPAGSGSVPGNGAMTLMAFILPIGTDLTDDDEWIFGNDPGVDAGFQLTKNVVDRRITSYIMTWGTGTGGAQLGIDCNASGIANHPLILHFTYDGSGNYASFCNGTLISVISGGDPFVPSPLPLLCGYAGGHDPFTGAIVAITLDYAAISNAQALAQTASMMDIHNAVAGLTSHCWTAQSLTREFDGALFDEGTATSQYTLALGGADPLGRAMYDVQYAYPLATEHAFGGG
jgi:hypothetical protein